MSDVPGCVLILTSYCLAIAAVSLLGGWVPLLRRATHGRLQGYLSFSAGVMLAAALGHMLPEAQELLGPVASVWALGGLVGLVLIERFLASHRHELEGGLEWEREGRYLIWRRMSPAQALAVANRRPLETEPPLLAATAIIGLGIHTLTAGVALASSATLSGPLSRRSVAVFVALLLHKPADSLTIATLALCSGRSRQWVHLLNLAYALVVPVGVAGFYLLQALLPATEARGWLAGVVLAVSAGAFLVIALADLLPELQFHGHNRVWLSVLLIAGVMVMMLPALLGVG